MSLQARTKLLTQSMERAKAVRVAQDAAEASACNRRSKRRQTALPGMMTFKGMRVGVVCTVIDMSGTGARIELPASSIKQLGGSDLLPDELTLILKADRMQVQCEVKWRRNGRIGVRFLGPPRPMERR